MTGNWDGQEKRRDNADKLDKLMHRFEELDRSLTVIKSFINSENGNHIHHLDAHYKLLAKHDELFHGNGKPGIIDILTRMDMNLVNVKEWMAAHKQEDDDKHRENLVKFETINKTLAFQNKVIYMALGMVALIEFGAKLIK